MRSVRRPALGAVLALVLAFLPFGVGVAGADAAFAVDSNGDQGDGNPGDGVCSVAADGSGPCTLRAAVEEANALSTPTVVTVPPMTIVLGSQLSVDFESDIAIGGAGASDTIVSTDGSTEHFGVDGGGRLELTDLTLRDGVNSGPGSVLVYGELVLDRVEVVENEAVDGEGGALEIAAVSTPDGDFYGDVTIRNSTIAGNSAVGDGGAIYSPYNDAGLSIENSTVTDNESGGWGGAIYLSDAGNVGTLNYVTMVDNTAAEAGDQLFVEGDGNVSVTGSILGGSGDNCVTQSGGTIESGGGNVVVGASCGFAAENDLEEAAMELGPLADNGGPTRTMAIAAGSPPVDNGLATTCPATDQRGVTRPYGAACDSGAYELSPEPPPTPTTPTTSTPTTGGTTAATVRPRFTG